MATQELWRAADDDFISAGTSFAETRDVAEAYLANPGFGGRALWTATVELEPSEVVDLRDAAVDELAAELGLTDPGAIGVDEWLPRSQQALDALRERGHLWARVSESYPHSTTTWIWLGSTLDDEPELIAA